MSDRKTTTVPAESYVVLSFSAEAYEAFNLAIQEFTWGYCVEVDGAHYHLDDAVIDPDTGYLVLVLGPTDEDGERLKEKPTRIVLGPDKDLTTIHIW